MNNPKKKALERAKGGKIYGKDEHSKVSFTPKSKSEERLFKKTFRSKTA